jgi:hypothetical protein
LATQITDQEKTIKEHASTIHRQIIVQVDSAIRRKKIKCKQVIKFRNTFKILKLVMESCPGLVKMVLQLLPSSSLLWSTSQSPQEPKIREEFK